MHSLYLTMADRSNEFAVCEHCELRVFASSISVRSYIRALKNPRTPYGDNHGNRLYWW